MRVFKFIILVLYFIYFSALFLGYPEFQISRIEKNVEYEFNLMAKELEPKIRVSDTETEAKTVVPAEKQFPIPIEWKAGFLQRFWLQYQAQGALTETFLEGEAKPEKLFQSLNRSLVKDFLLLGSNFFWCLLLYLCLLVYRQPYSFLNSLSAILINLSTFFITLSLTLYYIVEWQDTSIEFVPIAIKPLVECLLLLASLTLFIWNFIPVKKVSFQGIKSVIMKLSYGKMVPYKRRVQDFYALLPQTMRSWLSFFYHFLIISFFALLLANLLLLPLYTLQLAYPLFFTLCIVCFLSFAMLYYAHAYWHIINYSEAKEKKLPASIGVGFLGYHLLQSVIFFVSILSVVAVFGGITLLLIFLNIDLIRNLY